MRTKKELGSERKTYLEWGQKLEKTGLVEKIWAHDVSLWSQDEKDHDEISKRLGWLDIAERMLPEAAALREWATSFSKNHYQHVFLLGMGGSALAGEVMGQILPAEAGFPELHVLDTTDPQDVQNASLLAKKAPTLFIAASKSGSTVEMKSLMDFFLKDHPAKSFIAITDEGSGLQSFAEKAGFARTFINDSNIGGRFSALSYFGLVPAVLCGINIEKLLHKSMQSLKGLKETSFEKNPGLDLGLFMGISALEGRDKLRLRLPQKLEPFGLWVEQLVAESSGKKGKGIVPLPLREGASLRLKEDEFYVSISTKEEKTELDAPFCLENWEDEYDLGEAFLRWEFATAVACHILDVNAFDQPNVQAAKSRAKNALASLGQEKINDGLSVLCSPNIQNAPSSIEQALEALTQKIESRSYFVLLAYLPRETEGKLNQMVDEVEKQTQRPTSIQFGPRYLHSTGQLHKGGANEGVFLVLTRQPEQDLDIPGESYSFGQLQRAQAKGDFEALVESGRSAILLDMPSLSLV